MFFFHQALLFSCILSLSHVHPLFKGQIKAKDIFIDFCHLRPGDFKISNEISTRVLEPIEIVCRIPFFSGIFQKNRASKSAWN